MSYSVYRRAVQFCAVVVVMGSTTPSCHGAAEAFERIANGAIVRYPTGVVRVEVCSDRVVHIVSSAALVSAKSSVPAVIRPCTGAVFTTSSDSSGVHILTGKLRIEVAADTGVVRFSTPDGQTILNEEPRNGRIIGTADGEGPLSGVEQKFSLSPGEALYGLGQHQDGILDMRNVPIRLLQANTDIAVPFLISSKGYGLLWNNPALTDFNPATETIHLDENGAGTFRTGSEGEYGFLLSGNYRKKLRLSVDGHQILDLQNMWLPFSAGAKIHLAANTTYHVIAETGGDCHLALRPPSADMAFHSDTGDAIDYYFFYGPEPTRVVAQYRELTGAAPLLPRWAYGFWQCRERYSSQQQLLDTAAEFRQRKIPVDVLVQDWQYWGKYGWNAMRFDERQYPAPATMMSELHKQDLHLVISVWAKFGAETAVNREMQASHLVLTSAATTAEPGETKEVESWADLFNPKARKAFWSDIDRNLFSLGLDGWWLDASEPEGDPLKNDVTFLGPGREVRNAFPLFETSAVYQGQRAATEDKRVVILSRSAYAGQQRNGSISWSGDVSGDWETLRRQIPAGLNFGMSGFPYWTTDIGGFFCPADQYTSSDYHELLIRWFQFGAFCPIFRIHGFRSKTEMWKYGPEVEQILRRYDSLRYRLLPYIYSSAWDVTDRGDIVMKALPFVYPEESSLRQVSDQYLFGDSLLVNPVIEPHATTRSVLLPAGDRWVDFWTGRSYRGGQRIVADAPLNRIPILVKEGSILPLGPIVQSASEHQDPLEIRIYGGKDASFDIYEDSGDGYAYERGAKSIIPLHWDDRRRILSIGDRSGSFPEILRTRTMRVVLVRPNHGVGENLTEIVDRTLTYEGQHLKIVLANKH
jgi:alpha-D-xyloside xylohydrolase